MESAEVLGTHTPGLSYSSLVIDKIRLLLVDTKGEAREGDRRHMAGFLKRKFI